MALIRLDGVGKTYHARRGGRVLIGRGGLGELFRRGGKGHVAALENITFHVDPGECLGIIGANGSGKSTLLKIVAGVTAPTTGSV
ncbi:MAG: ATP-binding cassette domain-containing protein, partial [Candidatus Hydrogenedentales bacterium]